MAYQVDGFRELVELDPHGHDAYVGVSPSYLWGRVYGGQVVGENRRPGDLNVNVCRAKQLNNIRAAGKDENPIITPHRKLTIETAMEWIEPDELLEVTPESLRLRKRKLSGSQRKR